MRITLPDDLVARIQRCERARGLLHGRPCSPRDAILAVLERAYSEREVRLAEFLARERKRFKREANGHSYSEASSCVCRECERLRMEDGRCYECGWHRVGPPGTSDRCPGCVASGLGA